MEGYWARRAINRRTALRGAAFAGIGAASLGFIGCGNDEAGTSGATNAPKLDSTKGKPGGTFKFLMAAAPASPNPVTGSQPTTIKLAGLVNAGLLQFAAGQVGREATGKDVLPDLAAALPEQTNDLTYVFKLKPAKFQNGRTVTSEDVRYSYDRYANLPTSAWVRNWIWLDKVETPDATTVVLKSKYPYADTLQSTATYQDGYILAKEFEESPDAQTKLMGAGPYVPGEWLPPSSWAFKRNPDFYDKPYPYFDEIVGYAVTDIPKRIADYSAKSVHMTHWFSVDDGNQIIKNRPDTLKWAFWAPGYGIFMRTDQAPFSDRRVRQALSMSINRKQIREAVSRGEGEDDHALSLINTYYGTRKVKDLGAATKYWEFNVADARKLLAAAGIDKPIESQSSHWDAAVVGQWFVDVATLTQATWKENGIANVKDVPLTNALYSAGPSQGRYEGMGQSPGAVINALNLKNLYFTAPDGSRSTANISYVNDARLNPLLDRQLTQVNLEERKKTIREIETILAEEQYRIVYSTYTQNWFADPALKNIQIPEFAFSGTANYMKFWSFETS